MHTHNKDELSLKQFLLSNKIVTSDEIDIATKEKGGKNLAESLINLGFIESIAIIQILSKLNNIPYVDLSITQCDLSLLSLMPADFMQGQHLMPFYFNNNNNSALNFFDCANI